MRVIYEYDIRQFVWNKELNTFFADGWNLCAFLPDNSMHPEAFPNGKKQFYIKNYKTGNSRRFRFTGVAENAHLIEMGNGDVIQLEETVWKFKSEDGILCEICVASN